MCRATARRLSAQAACSVPNPCASNQVNHDFDASALQTQSDPRGEVTAAAQKDKGCVTHTTATLAFVHSKAGPLPAYPELLSSVLVAYD